MPRGVRAAAARARTRAPRARARTGGSAGGRIDLLGLSRRLGGAWCMHSGGAAAPRGVVGMGVDRQGRRSGSETPGSSVPGCQAAGRLCCAVGSVPCTAKRRLVSASFMWTACAAAIGRGRHRGEARALERAPRLPGRTPYGGLLLRRGTLSLGGAVAGAASSAWAHGLRFVAWAFRRRGGRGWVGGG